MNKIRANDLVEAVRSRMGDEELMEEYQLSPKGLQRLLQMLINTKSMNHEELYEMSGAYRSWSASLHPVDLLEHTSQCQ